MKKKIFIMVALLGYVLSSCTMYKPFMSEPSREPIAQKLPKMDFEWYTKGDVKGSLGTPDETWAEEFIKGIVRDEINQNIATTTGAKQGTIEVSCEKLHIKRNAGFALLTGYILGVAPLFGAPITSTKIDLTLSFNILHADENVLNTYKYLTHQKSALGF